MSDEPVRIADAIRQMVTRQGWSERLALGRLKNNWGGVVGEQIGAHSEPVKLAAGVLTLRADAGAWATELTLLAEEIVRRVNGFLETGKVRDLKVVAGR